MTSDPALRVVAVHDDDLGSTLRLTGELDLSTADLVITVARQELTRGRRTPTVDLAQVGFPGCAGPDALLAGRTLPSADVP